MVTVCELCKKKELNGCEYFTPRPTRRVHAKSILHAGINISTQFHLADLNSSAFLCVRYKMIFNSHLNVLIMQYIRIEIEMSADCTCGARMCYNLLSYF